MVSGKEDIPKRRWMHLSMSIKNHQNWIMFKSLLQSNRNLQNIDNTVDGKKTGEVVSLSHYLQRFVHPRWLAGFLPSTVWTSKIWPSCLLPSDPFSTGPAHRGHQGGIVKGLVVHLKVLVEDEPCEDSKTHLCIRQIRDRYIWVKLFGTSPTWVFDWNR